MTDKDNNTIGVNKYDEDFSTKTKKNFHRIKVGGLWNVMGQLQLDFLKSQGLSVNHKFLDIGCGCLRGGVKFIEYLNSNCYFGMDSNRSLIEAGKKELVINNLVNKKPVLNINDRFDFDGFNTKFDYMLAFSLFTHLHMNLILLCLKNVKKNLRIDGVFFATFFCSPNSIYEGQLVHEPGEIITSFSFDPYHYSVKEIELLANHAGLSVRNVSSFKHPRAQSMFMFSHK